MTKKEEIGGGCGMTEKRFTETLSTGIVTDHKTGREYKCEMRIDDELLKLLNELHEANMILKGEVAHYKLILMSLEKEAKRLSQIHCRGDVE